MEKIFEAPKKSKTNSNEVEKDFAKHFSDLNDIQKHLERIISELEAKKYCESGNPNGIYSETSLVNLRKQLTLDLDAVKNEFERSRIGWLREAEN